MKAIDAIRGAFAFADRGMKVLEDMASDPFVQPGPWGGNHAMWVAGHITFIEGRLQKVMRGIPNPVEHWKPLFDWDSEPTADPSAYPPYEEVLETYRRLRAETYAFLDEIGDAGMDRPTKCPIPGFGPALETIGPAMIVFACHQVGHIGGATVARRAAGKPRMFVPSAEQRAF